MNPNAIPPPSRIVTHPGSAHTDDITATALILGKYPELTVERRAPEEEDLTDPSVFVVDIGNDYTPDLRNFDHHQDHPSVDGCCATSLVLSDLSELPLSEVRELFPWLRSLETLDNRGPSALATKIGITVQQFSQSRATPLDSAFRNLFAARSELPPDHPLSHVLAELGRDILKELEARQDARSLFAQNARRVEIGPWYGIRLDPIDTNISPPPGFEDWLQQNHPNAAFTITGNKRGGIALTRLHENNPLDFRRLKDQPGVIFVHKNGFMAVVKSDPTLRYVSPLDLVERAF